MKRKIGYLFLSVALLFFGASIIIYPQKYISCCFQGFCMWAECVLPSLFPFMVITLIFVKTGIAERASLPLKPFTSKLNLPAPTAACFVLSIFSGYPAGSRTVAEFYEKGCIPRRELPKTAYLCSTSGPLFIVGSVGLKMFKDPVIGYKILACHLLSVTAVSLVISLLSKRGKSGVLPKKAANGNVLYDCFYSAVIAVTVAGGFISFFFTLATFFSDFNLFFPIKLLFNPLLGENISSALCLGLVEATTGCLNLASCGGKLPVALAGFLITFGGLSILLQQLSYLIKAGVKPLKFISVKFIQGVICFLLLLVIA